MFRRESDLVTWPVYVNGDGIQATQEGEMVMFKGH